MNEDRLVQVIRDAFISPNVNDSNGEPANIVDAIAAFSGTFARALSLLGNADASTPMGALEAHGKTIENAAIEIARAIDNLADAVREKDTP